MAGATTESADDQVGARIAVDRGLVDRVCPPAANAAAPDGADDDLMSQLNQMAQLHQAGVLTDDEFSAAKAKLLS